MENYALVQRPAPFSWEALTILTGLAQQTGVVNVEFPRPVLIVAAYPSVALAGGSDVLPFPTLDDLLVRIDQDEGQERRLTSGFDTTVVAGGQRSPTVTLGSFRDTTGGARTMDLKMGSRDSRPILGLTFSWKRPIAGGPYFQDVYVGLCLHCEFQGEG